MPTAATQSDLEAALAKLDARRPAKPAAGTPGAQAYVRHTAYLASIEAIRAQHAAAISGARGYNPDLGAIYDPADTNAFLADQLEASGVAVVREAYGFRTMTATEKAASLSSLKAA